jgi:hypothetical protein
VNPSTTEEVDLEALVVDQDVTPDQRFCHVQAARNDEAGERVWSSDRPLCGDPRATRCPGRRLTAAYAGERLCPACGRPYCPVCIAQDRGTTL